MSWPAEAKCPLCENSSNTNMVLPLTLFIDRMNFRIFPCDKHRGDIGKLVEYLHKELCV
jgi:hypothetical protein